jgi:ribosomal protein S18 acetylase RimI-like enzyme
MTDDIQVRLAIPVDASPIVEIIRQGFSPALLDCMIYGCAGISTYVEQQITLTLADTFFAVAVSGRDILGCIELRLFPDTLFLNYIAVRPEVRGLGIGSRLLKYALEIVSRPVHRTMQLDVFEENRAALAWYERLGFDVIERRNWWEIQLAAPDDVPEIGYISGYPQAEICQREFGFSQFRFVTSGGEYTIGRIGNRWFRITQPSAVEDRAVLSMLSHLAPNRHVLAIVPGTLPQSISHQKQLTQTCRMAVSLKGLIEKLGGGK